MFMHFSVLFHRQKTGCKAARGKHDMFLMLPDRTGQGSQLETAQSSQLEPVPEEMEE